MKLAVNRWSGLGVGLLLGILWFLANALVAWKATKGVPTTIYTGHIVLGCGVMLALGAFGYFTGRYYRLSREQLRTCQNRTRELETLFNHIAELILVVDDHARVVRFASPSGTFLGVNRRTLGHTISEFAPGIVVRRPDGTVQPLSEAPIARALRGEEVRNEALTLEYQGEKVNILTSASPIMDESTGRVMSAVVSSRDVTELRQLERLKNEFISTASHELRTPITVMRALAQLTLRDLQTDAASREDVQETIANQEGIILQADRVADLLNQMLDTSHLDTGKMVLRLRPTQLPELLDAELARLKITYPSHHLVLDLSGATKPWSAVQIDPDKIVRVFANLISNAVKYAPAATTVTVRVKDVPGGVEVAVQDQGIGIPPGEREMVFAKFYRSANAVNSDQSGLGLGLYISRRLIELHGGHLWVDSSSPKGTTFRFTLPADPPAEQPAPSATPLAG